MKASRRVALSLAAGLLAAAGTARRAGAQTANLVVAAPPTQDTAPILYALKTGAFEQAGLTVALQQMQNGAAISAAMIGGSVDVGLSNVPGLIVAHARGVAFEIIFPTVVYSSADPYALMFVRKDSAIRSARDLNGKVVASPALKDLDWIANMAWIDRNGGDSKSVRAIELPTSALLPALVDGRIDAYTIGQPWAAVALDSGKARVLSRSFDAIAPRFLLNAWFSTADIVGRKRATIETFARVMRDATSYTRTHPAEVAPLLATFAKLDPDQALRAMKGMNLVLSLDPRDVQPMIDAAVKYGIIAAPFDAREIVSPTLLRR